MELDYLNYNINRLTNEHKALNCTTKKLQNELKQFPTNTYIQINLTKFKKRKLFVKDQLNMLTKRK